MSYWSKCKQINETEQNPLTEPYTRGQLIFNKNVNKATQQGTNHFSTDSGGITGQSYANNNNTTPTPISQH